MKVTSSVRNVFCHIFKTSYISKECSQILYTADVDFFSIDLRKDLKLENDDMLMLYANTCMTFDLFNMDLNVFEKINTLGDLYKVIKFFYKQQH